MTRWSTMNIEFVTSKQHKGCLFDAISEQYQIGRVTNQASDGTMGLWS
jgi:hypothetical protein